ncbi:MAG: AraC family transcriptional regulator [Bacteroidota bacterium]
MFFDPSSQHLNQFRQTEEIPARLQSLVIQGGNRRCLISRGIQILSQQIVHPEFDLYVHLVFSKDSIELFGKATVKKWLWVIQHEGDAEISFAGGESFALKANQHFFVQAEGAKENRFTFSQGRSVTVIVSLKPAGEKVVRQFYPDLWKRLQSKQDVTLHSSTYIEHYYREGLIQLVVPAVLLSAFLSAQWRMLLLLFCRQLNDVPLAEGKVVLAKQLLDQYPAQAWNLHELARRVGWNVQDLKTVFKRIYSVSPIEYLRHVRLELGILLVRSTTKPIVEIARECGFKRAHHFIRVFKAFTGKTPGQVRRER